jgi:putative RNA 2'-phosphotransferase
MSPKDQVKTSKFLSLMLRHEPERFGLKLDTAGWVSVSDLLQAVNANGVSNGVSLNLEQLQHIVATSDKKRFAFNEDNTRMRASQGHSVEVDLQYSPQVPPELLYHGTATRFLDSIREKGLLKMERHHVHLSAETSVTVQVGARHGKPALLTIRASEMHRAGHVFFLSANGVWLVEQVPPQFIVFPQV